MRVGYESAIIISYLTITSPADVHRDSSRVPAREASAWEANPTSASDVIVLLKTPAKYREFFPPLFIKTTDFQLVFNFEQTRTVSLIIWRAWYNGSYTMMAKPIRALELNYPMIQFLIITITYSNIYL